MSRFSMRDRFRDSRTFQKILNFTKSLWMLSLRRFGKTKMSRRVFFASSLVDAAKNFRNLVVGDLEVRLISSYAEILRLLNHNSCSMCIRLHQEASIHQAREVQPSVSLFISPKTLKLVRLFLKVVLWYSQTEAYAVLTSSTKWMTALESFFTKLWSNRPCQ